MRPSSRQRAGLGKWGVAPGAGGGIDLNVALREWTRAGAI